MRLSVNGCPDKKRFLPYVRRAIDFYCEKLMSKKLLENIHLRVKFNDKLEYYGCASVKEYNDSGKPREFIIEIHPGTGAYGIIKTLAHEIVHIKQFAYCETNESLTRWKGSKIDPCDVDYYWHPWEIEAYGLEVGLFTKFVIQERLWEVFKDFCKPDDPILSTKIEWLKDK